MPGLYSIVAALQDMRAELKGAADDADEAAASVRRYGKEVEKAEATTSAKGKAPGTGATDTKALVAAIGAVSGRTGKN